jgi:hypothetical protein
MVNKQVDHGGKIVHFSILNATIVKLSRIVYIVKLTIILGGSISLNSDYYILTRSLQLPIITKLTKLIFFLSSNSAGRNFNLKVNKWGVWSLNHDICIYNAIFLSTELSSWGPSQYFNMLTYYIAFQM